MGNYPLEYPGVDPRLRRSKSRLPASEKRLSAIVSIRRSDAMIAVSSFVWFPKGTIYLNIQATIYGVVSKV